MFKNGRFNLVYSECRYRGRFYILLFYNAVKRVVNKIKLKIKDLEKKCQIALNSLLKLKVFLKSKRYILEFAETQIKE